MISSLEVRDLHKHFGEVHALDGFDLAVNSGEIVGLVGHNGAGKTTFARAVAGLIKTDAGQVEISGLDVAREPIKARSRLGLAPQELALYPTATARENLLLFAGLYGMSAGEATRRTIELTEAMALADVLDRRVRDLSGGMQRRLQAATAMIHRPRVLLLDEPTVGADPITRDALLAVVRQAADDGAAVVYTTHYLPELDVLKASLAVADHGYVIARGERAELLGALCGHATLTFDGPAPEVELPSGDKVATVERDGSQISITAHDPAHVVAAIVACPAVTARLRAVDVRPPSLDDLYHHMSTHPGR